MTNISLKESTPLHHLLLTDWNVVNEFGKCGYRWCNGFLKNGEPVLRHEAAKDLVAIVLSLDRGVKGAVSETISDEEERETLKSAVHNATGSKLNRIDKLLKLCEMHPALYVEPEAPQALRTYGVADALALTTEEPEQVFTGLVKGTVGLLIGATKVGKSFLALELGLSIATGKELLSGLRPRKGKSLMLLGEDSWEHVTGIRLRNLCARFGLSDVSDLTIVPQQVRPLVEAVDGRVVGTQALRDLEATIVTEGYTFVVVDSYARFLPVDENDQTQQTQALQLVEAVAERTGCSILLLHHVPKAETTKSLSISSARGAGAIAATVRTVFALQPSDKGGDPMLTLVGSNCIGHFEPIYFKREGSGALQTFDAEALKAEGVRDALLGLIPEEGIRRSDLLRGGLQGLSVSREEKEKALGALLAEGRIEEKKRGRLHPRSCNEENAPLQLLKPKRLSA